jgi:hypothetical protein
MKSSFGFSLLGHLVKEISSMASEMLLERFQL